MYFQYDTSGTPLGFIYNGAQYFYVTNQMGDVIVIIAADGDVICQYLYDEWGKVLGAFVSDEDNTEYVTVANANPLRYRGYYYDNETGYYYLQSRYYDPSICRFINADVPEIAQMTKDIICGENIFSYCDNDPINNMDPNGYCFFNAQGKWCHDNWEYNGRYKIKPDPFQDKFLSLSNEEKVVIAIVCGEAIGQGPTACKAVMWVMANRVGVRDWKNQKSIYAVATAKKQFDAYNGSQYKKALQYLNSGKRNNKTYEEIIRAIMPIYRYFGDRNFRKNYDISNGAQFFCSPNMKNLPSWTRSKYTVKVTVKGVSSNHFLFYKYK